MTARGLLAKLNAIRPVLVVGACFAAFGIGGIAFSVLVFPWLYLLPLGGRRRRQLLARRIVGAVFSGLVKTLVGGGVMRMETEGLERLKQAGGMLVLANHITYIDVVVLLSYFPEAECVVKAALWRNPFFWSIVRTAGYISNARQEALPDVCAAHLAAGRPVLIFPQGTRATPGQPLRFQRGAAYAALKSRRPILPVLILCDPPALTKHRPWYHLPPQPFRYRVLVREPASVESLADAAEASPLAARRLTAALENLFTRELETHGHL